MAKDRAVSAPEEPTGPETDDRLDVARQETAGSSAAAEVAEELREVPQPEARSPVVGIGASAGGLEALEDLFHAMAPDPGAAFVIVQHLDPSRPSLMAQLLERVTSLPIRQATDGVRVEANEIYLMPPNASLAIEGGVLRVTSPMVARHGPIDAFFRSLAADQDGNVIGVVLSGTGSDGTLGLKAVKEHGGIAMAQAIESARYDSMPRSAIALGLVDVIASARDLAAKVVEYAERLRTRIPIVVEPAGAETTEASLRRIFSLLQQKTGHDFSRYKRSTLARRIQRRMNVLQASSLHEYVETLSRAPAEIEQLFRDILIGVTQFFRDSEAFEALAKEVIPAILQGKNADNQLRVWVPGCASGEEAYSIAILIAEALPIQGPAVKIFATDIDDHALDIARNGQYPETIAEHVSAERLERFFVGHNDNFRVRKEIRDMCVFSTHNVISDPPFSRLDLVACRNVLIYLENEVQRNLLPLFHYALNQNGYLFLGPSENVSSAQELFRAVDKKSRIFQRRDAVIPVAFPIGMHRRGERGAARGAGREPGAQEHDAARTFERIVLERYAPAAVIVNYAGEIAFVSGKTGKYLELSPGMTSVNVVDMARKELRPDLHTALHKSMRARQEVVRRGLSIEVDGHVQRLDLLVRPLIELGPDADLFIVVFQEEGPAISKEQGGEQSGAAEEGDTLAQMLEAELRSTKENLQTTIEELETSNEELKSTNEELLSTNEELQSANEEMQTSREELQSINEELQTVNAELSRKVDELDKLNSDLQNLFASTRIPTVFLDNALRIKKFSPAATEVFRLIDSDVGRPITDIAAVFTEVDLTADVREVLRTLIPIERQVRRTDTGGWHLMRVLPYRSIEDTIEGVVITFVDITDLKQAQDRANSLAAIVDSSYEAIIGLTPEAIITTWNLGAERVFGVAAAEAIERPLGKIVPDISEDVMQRLMDGERVGPFTSSHLRHDGSRVHMIVTASPVLGGDGAAAGASLIAHDTTEQELAKRAFKRSEERYRQISESSVIAISFFDPQDGRLTEANDAFRRLTGLSRDDLQAGRFRWHDLTPLEWRAAGDEVMEEIKSSGRCKPTEIECFRRDGSRFWALASGAMLKEGAEGVILLVDNTEQKRAEESLLEADRRKNEFMSTLAHELRNPLAPIRNAIQYLMHAPPSNEAAARCRQIIARQVRHMASLIDDLLDVSRISAGKILLRMERVDLIEIARTVAEDHQSEADNRRVSLDISVPDAPLWTQGDPIRLAQSLGNLVDNALKFTDPGGRVAIALDADEAEQMAILRVRDTGAGMTLDMLEKAFEPYTQGDTARGGLGVGLPLVKGLIDLHGGTVSAASEGLGHGTEVVLRVPLRHVEPEVEEAEAGQHLTRRVLIIEDNADAAETTRMLLELAGHEVASASSGADGVALARSFRPEIVLCDIGLPGMSGYDVARALRQDPESSGAVLIALSGYGRDEDRELAREAGFDRHVTKPVDPDVVLDLVARPNRA